MHEIVSKIDMKLLAGPAPGKSAVGTWLQKHETSADGPMAGENGHFTVCLIWNYDQDHMNCEFTVHKLVKAQDRPPCFAQQLRYLQGTPESLSVAAHVV